MSSIQDLTAAVQGFSDAVQAAQNQPDTTRLSAADQAAIDGAVNSIEAATAQLQALVNPAPPVVEQPAPDIAGGTSPDVSTA